MAPMVGQLYLKSKNPREASCSSIERLSSVNISSATALDKNSFLISDVSKSCIIRKSKFPQNPKRSVRFSGKGTKRSVQKRKARNTQKAETKVL